MLPIRRHSTCTITQLITPFRVNHLARYMQWAIMYNHDTTSHLICIERADWPKLLDMLKIVTSHEISVIPVSSVALHLLFTDISLQYSPHGGQMHDICYSLTFLYNIPHMGGRCMIIFVIHWHFITIFPTWGADACYSQTFCTKFPHGGQMHD